jgi:hypothetical protein
LRESGESPLETKATERTVVELRQAHKEFEEMWQLAQPTIRRDPGRVTAYAGVFVTLSGLLWNTLLLHVRLHRGYGNSPEVLNDRMVVLHYRDPARQYQELATIQNSIKRLAQDLPNAATRTFRSSFRDHSLWSERDRVVASCAELETEIVRFFRAANVEVDDVWSGIMSVSNQYRWPDGYFHASDDGTLIAPTTTEPFDLLPILVATEKRVS